MTDCTCNIPLAYKLWYRYRLGPFSSAHVMLQPTTFLIISIFLTVVLSLFFQHGIRVVPFTLKPRASPSSLLKLKKKSGLRVRWPTMYTIPSCPSQFFQMSDYIFGELDFRLWLKYGEQSWELQWRANFPVVMLCDFLIQCH